MQSDEDDSIYTKPLNAMAKRALDIATARSHIYYSNLLTEVTYCHFTLTSLDGIIERVAPLKEAKKRKDELQKLLTYVGSN